MMISRQVDAIATLYAVWNDAPLDVETHIDDWIIRGGLAKGHLGKKEKFTATDLKTWLAWMRRNSLIAIGAGSRTQLDLTFA